MGWEARPPCAQHRLYYEQVILLLYNLLIHLALIPALPWLATAKKYRESLRQRLGFGLLRVTGPTIWVHAVSVGEVLAVGRLVAELEAAHPDTQVVISTTTRTGQHLARQRFGTARVFYCPLDIPWAVERWFGALNPRLLVLTETEFWPNMLATASRRGTKIAVVNARISDRSFPRYRRLRGLWRPFLQRLDCVLAQSELDAERLREIGCRPERVTVAGNLKFDIRIAKESAIAQQLRTLGTGLRWVIAGSTLDDEEATLLDAWRSLDVPNVALILAPRHPERFDAVAELLAASNITWQRRSAELHAVTAGSVLLLDSIGELASLYALASVAFVGGSLIPAGGHNPLEPAQFSVPVVMGQSVENFRGIVAALRAQNAVQLVTRSELRDTLHKLLADHATAQAMGERGHAVFEAESGATARVLAALTELLP